MAQDINLQSAGVTTREIDLSGPRTQGPVGIPAGIIGTAQKGPAFVPVTLAKIIIGHIYIICLTSKK